MRESKDSSNCLTGYTQFNGTRVSGDKNPSDLTLSSKLAGFRIYP